MAKVKAPSEPVWYLSMSQYLDIVTDVVRKSDTYVTREHLHDKSHPEDLFGTVESVAEIVSLTIVALGKHKSHMFETNEV